MTENPTMSMSQWGQFEAPIRVLRPVFTMHGVKVRYPQPIEYFDGGKWERLADDAAAWFKSHA